MADTQWNIEHLLATAVAYMRDVGMPNEADAIIELQRRAATPPADAALADELLRLSKAFDTSPNNAASVSMNRRAADSLRDTLIQAAARLRALSQPEVAQVPIEWRRTVRELMTLTNFRPLCQKNVMDGCRCYDCVMERAGAILDEQSPLSATPLPADAVLADAVALLRRTYQNHWPSTEIKAFLAKIDAMPDAALRALSQPEVAQVPQSWIDAATKAKQLTPDVCKAYPGAASAHIAGLANLILRMAAPSAKIDAMPDAALRALSQPEVAQVPAVPMAAIETVLHFCSPHEDASKEDCSKCSAAYEEVSNWRDALLSAAPSAKGGE